MEKFKRTTRSFNYVYERHFDKDDEIIVDMEDVSPNKRGVCDIGWQAEGDVTLYGTLTDDFECTDLWEKIPSGTEINKAISAFKIVAKADAHIIIRVIMQ